MNSQIASIGFSAMGAEARPHVLQALVKAGDQGLLVGEIQQRLDIPPSTLAHHLKHLTMANLIIQERRGRAIISRANFEHLNALAAYILDECCIDEEQQND